MLKENNRLITEEKELATVMNTFFVNITESLDLKKDDDSSLNPINSENINDILEKHKHHPSVQEISQTTFVDILKSTADIHLPFITNSINVSIEKGCFPEELTLAEVSPIFKKKDDLDKENYRPVSVLPHVSKVFERIICHQINDYKLSKIAHNIV